MADIEARREARRKRILENSHNRLQLISGKCSNEDFSVASKESTDVSPIPHKYESALSPLTSDSGISEYSIQNGGLGTSTGSFEPLILRHDVASGDEDIVSAVADWIAPTSQITPENVQLPLWKLVVTYKYDIVLLSLVIQFIHTLTAFPLENSYFFVPLLIYSITKSLWLPKQNNSSIANLFLLLNGMSSNGMHKIINVLLWAGAFSQDACIFLFTTICIQMLYNLVRDNFVT
ncbi:unnamed protein product [Diatraea saccharalis]|uniref:Uncharacterized protein n=1 Tax=Diatraea saccharalis TaxID=40085 RepID=A0A9P0C0T9_9NEOP|nr:unnamed protein product [Diatraea saccharalis]